VGGDGKIFASLYRDVSGKGLICRKLVAISSGTVTELFGSKYPQGYNFACLFGNGEAPVVLTDRNIVIPDESSLRIFLKMARRPRAIYNALDAGTIAIDFENEVFLANFNQTTTRSVALPEHECIAVSKGGTKLAWLSLNPRQLGAVVDIATSSVIAVLPNSIRPLRTRGIGVVRFAPDEQSVTYTGYPKTAYIYNCRTASITTLPNVRCFTYDSASNVIGITYNNEAWQYKTATGALSSYVALNSDAPVTCCACTASGQLITANTKGVVEVWTPDFQFSSR
jgi:hypothetical protein